MIEDQLEQEALGWLADVGWQHRYGPELAPDGSLRDALPNATFVAFTGTPVSGADRDTRAVFGDYISVYDMQQAKEDGATVAIYYESRLAKLGLKAEDLALGEDHLHRLEEGHFLAHGLRFVERAAQREGVAHRDRQAVGRRQC